MAITEDRPLVEAGQNDNEDNSIHPEALGVYLYGFTSETPPDGISSEDIGRIILNNISETALDPFPNRVQDIFYFDQDKSRSLIRIAEVCLLISTE